MIKLLLFLLYPAIELFLLVKLGSLIGGLWTVVFVFASAAFGFWLIKTKCRRGVEQLSQIVEANEPSKEAVLNTLLLFFAGVFFILPGVLSDLAGILLLFPFVRRLILATAGSALYRVSQQPGSGFYSATRLFVYDEKTGDYRTASAHDEAKTVYTGQAYQSPEKLSPDQVVFDCEPALAKNYKGARSEHETVDVEGRSSTSAANDKVD